METEAYRTPIQRFYAEQSIFITGIYSPQVLYFTCNLLISLYIYIYIYIYIYMYVNRLFGRQFLA